MNTKEYIESGILEEYVLGTVSPQEKREVECLSGIYPEIRQELDALSSALEQYAETLRLDPPASVKERLLKDLDFSPTAEAGPVASPENTPPVRSLYPTESISERPAYRGTWLVAASVGLLLLVFSFFMYSQLQDSRESVSDLRTSNQSLQSELRQLREEQLRSQQTLAVLKEPGTQVIRLNPTDSTTANLVTLYWNTRTGSVKLELDSLARPSEFQQYQLWAIVDGKPVDAGVFDVTNSLKLVQQTKTFPRAEAFAITLEKRGGSPTPTLDAMVVLGKVSS